MIYRKIKFENFTHCLHHDAITRLYYKLLVLLFCIAEVKKKRRAPTQKVIRHNWTNAEKEEVKKLFADSIKNLLCPNKTVLQKAIEISRKNGGLIFKQPLKNIQKQVSNMIDKIKKGK